MREAGRYFYAIGLLLGTTLLLLHAGCGGQPWEAPRNTQESLLYVAAETRAVMLTVDALHLARNITDQQAIAAVDHAEKVDALVRGGTGAYDAGDLKTAEGALMSARAALHFIRKISGK